MEPLISICIPSYRHPEFLKRCLESILKQDYTNIEVIISDDTPDNSVKIIAEVYCSKLRIKYYQNIPSLGTPANWNAALDKASGEFIMLLHHDDWLNNPEALSNCILVFKNTPSAEVVFERGITADRSEDSIKPELPDKYYEDIYINPILLLLHNVIGPPSNIIMRNTIAERYDEHYKWLVDIEFYIRLIINGRQFAYTNHPIVSVGIHPSQMSNFCKKDGVIILKENVYFAFQYVHLLKGLKVYDYYWRLLRNSKIRSISDLIRVGLNKDEIPAYIKNIVNIQKKLPAFLLRGAFSKFFMTISYFFQ